MKKSFILALFGFILLASCSKSGGEDTDPVLSYMSLTAGQIRTFEVKDSLTGALNTVIQTSSNADTMVGSRSYHVFNESDGNKQYFNISGNDYYTLFNIPGVSSTTPLELLYLKANATVGTSWSQNFSFTLPGVPLPVPVTFTHTLKETGLTKTTGAITHQNVIRVETKVSSTLASITSDIQTYSAPNYGVVHISTYIAEPISGIEVNNRRTLIGANF